MKRVVVSGMGGISPIGSEWARVSTCLQNGVSGISRMADWDRFSGLQTKLASPVTDFELPDYYDRRKIRAMGRVARLAVRATELALKDAGLLDSFKVTDGSMGIAYGSATGSPEALSYFGPLWFDQKMRSVSATAYFQMMSHTCGANIAVLFGITGRLIPTCSACTSGSQGIGFAYEAIRQGKQVLMVAGGAEELCPSIAAVFDSVRAASTRNEEPSTAVRPFDLDRDGVVIGEGAGTLVLEELSHAQARGAKIYAEIVGFGTNTDGEHLARPHADKMENSMRLCLADADLSPHAVGYVNAHATGTPSGDIAESIATQRVFGERILISSLKGHIGHTLGACGALEAWMAIEMLRAGWFAPTLNLTTVDPQCPNMDYLQGSCRYAQVEYLLSNNFGFGGTNTSLLFRRWEC